MIKKNNKFLIITGISGAGKSQALKLLEDFGFICIDNIPLEFFMEFIDLYKKNINKYKNVALSVDIRARYNMDKIPTILKFLKHKKINSKILFFDATDSTILKRYSETRRKHPLGLTVKDGLLKERKMMKFLKSSADIEIDTTNKTIGELKTTLAKLIGLPLDKKQLMLSIMSFGFKYGIPTEADIVLDARFIPNPNYVSNLQRKTGKDKEVIRYVEKQKEYLVFFNKLTQMLDFLLPNYIKEGKSHLTVAVGCTGGRHRSVACAEKLSKYFIKSKYKVKLNHRDIFRA